MSWNSLQSSAKQSQYCYYKYIDYSLLKCSTLINVLRCIQWLRLSYFIKISFCVWWQGTCSFIKTDIFIICSLESVVVVLMHTYTPMISWNRHSRNRPWVIYAQTHRYQSCEKSDACLKKSNKINDSQNWISIVLLTVVT